MLYCYFLDVELLNKIFNCKLEFDAYKIIHIDIIPSYIMAYNIILRHKLSYSV